MMGDPMEAARTAYENVTGEVVSELALRKALDAYLSDGDRIKTVFRDHLSQAHSIIAALRVERDSAVETLRYCERNWSEERGTMIDKFVFERNRAETAEAQVKRLTEEKEALSKDAERDNKIIGDLQAALAYWMPSVRPETDGGLPRSAGDDALLLFGHEGREQGCWGDDMLVRIKALEETVEFVHRWAVQKEGNSTSAEERLSAIAYHPGVQALSGSEKE